MWVEQTGLHHLFGRVWPRPADEPTICLGAALADFDLARTTPTGPPPAPRNQLVASMLGRSVGMRHPISWLVAVCPLVWRQWQCATRQRHSLCPTHTPSDATITNTPLRPRAQLSMAMRINGEPNTGGGIDDVDACLFDPRRALTNGV